jgi:Integrase core domain
LQPVGFIVGLALFGSITYLQVVKGEGCQNSDPDSKGSGSVVMSAGFETVRLRCLFGRGSAHTTNPTGAWVAQQARNLSFTSLFERMRFLIHDRDSKFTASFDEVFHSEGITVIHAPVRAPRANAFAERFVRTVRTECLDWLLIVGRRHLDAVLRIYVQHYNRERPNRGLALQPPAAPKLNALCDGEVRRRDRLGGLLHEYDRAAA